jgi:predicted Rossmann fold nucleotide-binding protein DprA/Smf involved in DNA uptake
VALSANTQAILLLTAPLLVGRGAAAEELLTAGEYRRLARCLHERQQQPADLLSPAVGELLDECRAVVAPDRARRLLSRGFLLSQAIERWRTRAIWVVSRADAEYPRRLKARLKDEAPAVLYGCGDASLLDDGGFAVVGSRNAGPGELRYAEEIGQLSARARKTLVSGGARGIDQAAMRGALEAGGRAIGVLGDALERAALQRDHRSLLMEDRLALVSPFDPNAGFNVGNAMQRNKIIYALADAALVVSVEFNKGGTWAGAVEQLDKFRIVPIYVRREESGKAGDALLNRGAMAWPEASDPDGFCNAIAQTPPPATRAVTSDLFEVREPEMEYPAAADPAMEPARASVSEAPADELFAAVRRILLHLLVVPRKETEIAAELAVSGSQAREWLQRLVAEDLIEKRTRPASYVVRQTELFERDRPPAPAATDVSL